MEKMTNIYQCDSYNIEKVTIPTGFQSFAVEIQRLPANTYPEKTQVYIPFAEYSFNVELTENSTDEDRASNHANAASLSKSDFLSVATTCIDTFLSEMDLSYDSSPSNLDDLSTYSSIY